LAHVGNITSELLKKHKMTDWYTDDDNEKLIRFVIDACEVFDLMQELN